MRVWRILLLLVFLLLLIPILSNPQSKTSTPPSKTVLSNSTFSSTSARCHIVNGVLPDPTCTPGSIDLNVTQSNIFQTICSKGYTKTVRPPVTYTNQLKIEQIAEYGYAGTNLRDYEEDHLISLELGGNPTDPKNLWPEPGASPNAKDSIENLCNRKVCDGLIALATAQKQIATNWQTACQ